MTPAEITPTTDAGPRRPSEAGTRTLLRVGAVTTAVGLALAASGDPTLARWLVLGGIVLLVLGLHRFGRLGTDEPIEFESKPGARSP